MSKRRILIIALVAATMLTGCARFAAGAKTLATVNGQRITQRDLDTRLGVYKLTYGSEFDPQANRSKVLSQMVEEDLLLQEANRRGTKPDPKALENEKTQFHEFLTLQAAQSAGVSPHAQAGTPDRTKAEAQLRDLMKKQGVTQQDLDRFIVDFVTIRGLIDQVVSPVQVADGEVRQYYDAHPDEFKRPEQVRASHILVQSEDEAKRIDALAKAPGADFAALAKQYSTDTVSKDKGGDLGYFARDQMVKEFADTAFSLRSGDISNPVKSQFGWHIIKVVDHRPAGQPSFDEAKEQVRKQALGKRQSDTFEKLLADLRASGKITPPELAKPKG